MKTIVVNLNNEPFDVYIGRGSIWGNPFIIGINGTRNEVIALYKNYILNNEFLMNQIETLRGKRLGCFCHPKRCHGDVIVEILEGSCSEPEEVKFSIFDI